MLTKKTPEKTGLESTIDKLIAEMEDFSGFDDEYAKMVVQLDTLYKLKEVDQKVDASKHVSRDTWAIVGANLAGILMIVGHERANVVTSKALNLLMKLR